MVLFSTRVAIKVMPIKFSHHENAYDVTLNFLKALDKNTQKNTGRKLTMLLIIVISVW